MSVGGTIAMGCALALFLALCFGYLARRSFKNFESEAELNAPLIDSEDRRLDAALRDANEGYNVCAVCEFENFKRFRFCTVCGEPIVGKDDDQKRDDDTKKAKKLTFSSMFRRKRHVQLPSATSVTKLSNQSTRRRLRAQRRKEWTRKIDVEGRSYWFRDSRFKADTLPAAFVVAFEPACSEPNMIEKSQQPKLESEELPPVESEDQEQTKPSKSLLAHSSNHRINAPNSPSVCEPDPEQPVGNTIPPTPRTTFGSVEKCMAILKNDVQELQSVLIPVSDTRVDASRLSLSVSIGPIGSTPAPDDVPDHATESTSVAELMALASRDFPYKYAHFVMAASRLLVPAEREHLRLNVERANVFKDSMESLAVIPFRNLHSVVRINFLDETGIDAGGLQREWFAMLNEALVDPAHGLFVCANKSEQTYFLRPCSNADALPRQLLNLLAAGRLLGRALLEGSILCFHLAQPLLKLMLGYPLSFADLEDLDPEVYTNLRWLLENDNVVDLGLDFTLTIKDGENYSTVELIPGGNEIAVTDSNKREYVERKWQYLLVESIAPQLQVFLQGLYEIISRDLLILFDPQEFDFLLCGSEEIDVDDWEHNTKHSEGLRHHRVRKWFWGLVREMPNEYRRRLLQFSTGSSRVPLGGFSALTSYDGRLCPFTLKAVPLKGDGFIHSHACFNRLDLPLHVVREELKAVLYATLETEVYGFTTE